MIKSVFFCFLMISSISSDHSSDNRLEPSELKPCPKFPNCVCTQDPVKRKTMDPISFSGSTKEAEEKLKTLISSYSNAVLIEQEGYYFHYTFETKLGKFIDDVEFLLAPESNLIHFRSASRKGYGDFGKNKRRMKGIVKDWRLSS